MVGLIVRSMGCLHSLYDKVSITLGLTQQLLHHLIDTSPRRDQLSQRQSICDQSSLTRYSWRCWTGYYYKLYFAI